MGGALIINREMRIRLGNYGTIKENMDTASMSHVEWYPFVKLRWIKSFIMNLAVVLWSLMFLTLNDATPALKKSTGSGNGLRSLEEAIENLMTERKSKMEKSQRSEMKNIKQLLKENEEEKKKALEKEAKRKETEAKMKERYEQRKASMKEKMNKKLLNNIQEEEMREQHRREKFMKERKENKYRRMKENSTQQKRKRENEKMNENEENKILKKKQEATEQRKRQQEEQKNTMRRRLENLIRNMGAKSEKKTQSIQRKVNSKKRSTGHGNELDQETIDPNSPIASFIQSMIDEKDGESRKPKGLDMSGNKAIKAEKLDKHLTSSHTDKRGIGNEELGAAKRNFIKPDEDLWVKGVIPYEISDDFTSYDKVIIRTAMKQMSDLTCVKFEPRTDQHKDDLNHETYIEFIDDWGCYSYVGRMMEYRQVISLQRPYCISVHTVLHEMMHAMGMMHEQSRADRDDHVIIHWDNMWGGRGNNNMWKEDTRDKNPYDLQSVMQYSEYAFSTNGKKTIETLDRRLAFLTDIEQGLDFYDVKDITYAYNCTAKCPENDTMECENGGFINHKCKCYCPPNLTGPTCEEIITNSTCGGIIEVKPGFPVKIQSPNYPENYSTGLQCTWLLKAPVGFHISLEINDLALSDNDLDRCYHPLEIRYNLIGQKGVRECGHTHNKNYVTTKDGTSNLMMLVFDSAFAADKDPDRGFSLTANAIHSVCLENLCVYGSCETDNEGLSFVCVCEPDFTGILCDTLIEPMEMQCTFEMNTTCFMVNSKDDDKDWAIHNGPTPTQHTGPEMAHKGNFYLYLEASEMGNTPRITEDMAILESNVIFPIGSYCLSFWYSMYGEAVHSLLVLRKEDTVNGTKIVTLWSKEGNQGKPWRFAEIDLTEPEFFIVGYRGMFHDGDIAIDDLKVTPGFCIEDPCDIEPCLNGGVCSHNMSAYTCVCHNGYTGHNCEIPPGTCNDTKLRCTFENGTDCFMVHLELGKPFDIVSDAFPIAGPSEAFEGHYFARSHYELEEESNAFSLMISRKFFSGREYCLTYTYYISDEMPDSGFIYAVSMDGTPITYFPVGKISNKWTTTGHTFPVFSDDRRFRLAIGYSPYEFNTSLSLDDIAFRPGICGCDSNPCMNGGSCMPHAPVNSGNYSCVCQQGYVGMYCEVIDAVSLTCSFEDDEEECFMENCVDSYYCDNHWKRGKGQTPTMDTGPTNASDGLYYMYLEDSDMYSSYEMVEFRLDGYKYTPIERCFLFDYHMYGSSINKLVVSHNWYVKWSKYGSQGNQWRTGGFQIKDGEYPDILMNGYASYDSYGDIAVDNLRLIPGPCGCKIQPCDNGGTCLETKDGDVTSTTCICPPNFTGETCETISALANLSCDFEPNEKCFLQNDRNDDFEWTETMYDTPTGDTGPWWAASGDYYSFIESSEPRMQGDRARLTTRHLDIESPAGPRCLRFKYSMFGDGIGSLRVLASEFKTSYLYSSDMLWSQSGDQYYYHYSEWLQAEIDIPEGTETIAVEGIVGPTYRGDIAIDDAHLTPGYCGCPISS